MISDNVALFGPWLRPALVLLSEAVETPQAASTDPAAPRDAQALCEAANRAQKAFTNALRRLQPDGGDSFIGGAAHLRAVAADLETASRLLAQTDAQVRQRMCALPDDPAATTLALASRDNLVLAAHLLADLIRVLCDPDAAQSLGGGERRPDGQVVIEFGVRFQMPEHASELAGWMPTRLAWRQHDVQTALRLAAMDPTPLQRRLRESERQRAAAAAVPPAPSRAGTWHALSAGLALAWLVSALVGRESEGD
jgi:hypothetical protein